MSEQLDALHNQIEQLRSAFNPDLLSNILNGFLGVLAGNPATINSGPGIPAVQQQTKLLSPEEETRKLALENKNLWTSPNCICCDSNDNTQLQRLPSSHMEEALCGRCNHMKAMPVEWYIDQLTNGVELQSLFSSPHTVWIEGKYIRFHDWYSLPEHAALVDNVLELKNSVKEEVFPVAQ